jgi:hydroxyethylthiazole kinase-like uncharacterized protein yjeF
MRTIGRALLRAHPLPPPVGGGKEARGSILVVAGSEEVPGAALLTAEAALRAGAGKLSVATPHRYAGSLGMALPEARILPLVNAGNHRMLEKADALVIGPGMADAPARRWAGIALASREDMPVLLDAAALKPLWTNAGLARRRREGRARNCILTPHAGELAGMSGMDKDDIAGDPAAAARATVERLGVTLVLKAGETTIVATADGNLSRYRAPIPGLAMSGSGDVLAGIIGGLLARGAAPLTACLWGVYLHAAAGRRLSQSEGLIGYRARDLASQVPGILQSFSQRGGER